MTRLIVIVTTLLALVGTVFAQPTGPTGIVPADKRYPIQVCTEQTGRQHGQCWWVQGFPVGSAGLGRTARIQAVSAGLYAWSVVNRAPIRIEIGAGTSAAALRVTTSTDSGEIALLEAIRDALQILDNIVETDRAAVNLIAGQIGVAAGAGAVDALTLRTITATDSPDVTALQILDNIVETGRAAVNLIAGQIGISADAGATDALTPRMILATDSPGVNTTTPAYCRQQDGDSAVLRDILEAFTDNLPLTLNAAMSAAAVYKYDGALLDMSRLNATGADLMGVEAWHCSYDTSNCNIEVDIDDRTPVHGITETSGTIVGAPTVVCTARDVSTDNKGCFYIHNQGGAGGGAFTAATWSTSWNNADYTTATDLGASCNALTTGQTCVFCWDDAYRWVRVSVTAAAAANDTTAQCTYEGKN